MIIENAQELIAAEARALIALSNVLPATGFADAVDLMNRPSALVIVTGMGKAGLIGAKIAATLRSTGQPASFLHPAEAAHGDMGMIGAGDVLLALSNSGETDEVLAVCGYCQRHQVPIIAITSKHLSPLAGAAQALICLPDKPEGCPIGKAPMASAAMMMAAGDALAGALLQIRGFTTEDFLELHHGGYLGRALAAVA